MEDIIEINGVKYQRVVDQEETTQNPTGWERKRRYDIFNVLNKRFESEPCQEEMEWTDDFLYRAANYFSDVKLADAMGRAVKLYLRMNRFAAEHQKSDLYWGLHGDDNYYIYYNHTNSSFAVSHGNVSQILFEVYFDSRGTAEAAIEEFHDELIWYFTEFKNTIRF